MIIVSKVTRGVATAGMRLEDGVKCDMCDGFCKDLFSKTELELFEIEGEM